MVGQAQIHTDDVFKFLDKPQVLGNLERFHPVRLEAVGMPDVQRRGRALGKLYYPNKLECFTQTRRTNC